MLDKKNNKEKKSKKSHKKGKDPWRSESGSSRSSFDAGRLSFNSATTGNSNGNGHLKSSGKSHSSHSLTSSIETPRASSHAVSAPDSEKVTKLPSSTSSASDEHKPSKDTSSQRGKSGSALDEASKKYTKSSSSSHSESYSPSGYSKSRIFDPSLDSPSKHSSSASFRESASYNGGDSYYGSSSSFRENYTLYDQKPPPPVLPNGERFPKKRKIRDVVMSIIFILHFVLFLGIGIASVAWNFNNDTSSTSGSSSSGSASESGSEEPPVLPLPGYSFLFTVIVSVITGVILSSIWALMMKSAAGATTMMAMFATMIFFLILVSISFYYQWWLAVIAILVIMILFVLFIIIFWRRIKFAMEVLRGVSTMLRGYSGPTFFSICMTVCPLAIYFFLWFGIFRSIVIRMDYEGITYVGVLMEIYLMISFYWSFFTFKNIVHATCCFFYCQRYFSDDPSNGLMKPFGKILGTNLGSVCLGSLVSPIVKFFRGFFAMFSTCNECGVSCIDSIGKYFNRFTFVHVAMYGDTYCNSAKSTWNMFLLHGFTAVVNQDMTGELLTISVLSVGAITGLISGFLAIFFYDATFGQGMLLMVVGLLLGLMTTNMVVEVFDSGAACLLVCFVEQPERLKEIDPEFYEKFQMLWGWMLPLFPPKPPPASSSDLLRSRQSFTQV